MSTLVRCLRSLLLTLLLFTWVQAIAGGIYVVRETVEFATPGPFEPRASVSLKFNAREYVYGSNEYAYLLAAIVKAKKNAKITEKELRDGIVYGTLIATPQRRSDFEEETAPFRFEFNAPTSPGKYQVVLGMIPTFRTTPFDGEAPAKQLFIPSEQAKNELLANSARYPVRVTDFEVVKPGTVQATSRLSVYLRINDQLPHEYRGQGGIRERPLTISWRVGDEFKGDKNKVLFRYQLKPDDDDWRAWTPSREVSYQFLQKGLHQFRIQAKVEQDGGKIIESPPANAQFAFEKDFLARPTKETLTKAPVGVVSESEPTIAFSEVYAKSRALLIGLWEFEDKKFPQFDGAKISADLNAMENALKANGFEVNRLLRAKVSREEIADALANLVDSAQQNDRLFIYFSTHGFADPLVKSDGYLATSDCKMSQPTNRCLRLNDLETQATRALEGKKVRQVLFAVDSCFSGLGIVRKATVVPDLTKLAVPQGAFMLTAGMANQLAQIDPTLGMSTFTHFLAEGLTGKADIMGNNGVITLSELFVYVQYEVAKQTGQAQIPMLGRMKGDGEMLFSPKSP